MRPVGIHIRLTSGMLDLLRRASALELPIFQCFLAPQGGSRPPKLEDAALEECIRLKREKFKTVYVHASYHANLCNYPGLTVLKREVEYAKRLELTQIVAHAGSAKWCRSKEKGIDVLVRNLNTMMKREREVVMILENGAHGGDYSIGGDIEDFMFVLHKIEYPDRLRFCIDTAHAYVYGYDVKDEHGQDQFIELIGKTMGFDRVALLHLNDTSQKVGSRIDQHMPVGEGFIGLEMLRRFAMHKSLASVPVILELPPVSEEAERAAYDTVVSWHVGS